MDTTIVTNILFMTLSIFLITVMIIFGFLITYLISTIKILKSLVNTTENQIKKVAEDIENIKTKAKYSQLIFASVIMHSLSFIKKTYEK